MEESKKLVYSFYPKNVNYCSGKYELSYKRERQLFLMSKMVITLAIQERQKWKCGKKHIKE